MKPSELGKEFWGIILFETHIIHLYQLLNIQRHQKTILEFTDWLLFPEKIPQDYRITFSRILQNRFNLAQYHQRLEFPDYVFEHIDDKPSIRNLSGEEIQQQSLAEELLKLKYQNTHIQPSTLFTVYEKLSYERFSQLLKQLTDKSYIDKYRAADYLIHHAYERGCTI